MSETAAGEAGSKSVLALIARLVVSVAMSWPPVSVTVSVVESKVLRLLTVASRLSRLLARPAVSLPSTEADEAAAAVDCVAAVVDWVAAVVD